MGEMADMLMDQIMCDDLYYDNVMYEEESDSYIGSGHRQRKPLYCRFCGQGPLLWDRTSNRWIMCENDGSIHDCPNYKLPIDVLKEFALKKKKDYQLGPTRKSRVDLGELHEFLKGYVKDKRVSPANKTKAEGYLEFVKKNKNKDPNSLDPLKLKEIKDFEDKHWEEEHEKTKDVDITF